VRERKELRRDLMKGIFAVSENKLGILELDEPKIGDYDALIEVKACGICNSTDLKILEGRFKKGSFPILLGHESSGKVVKVGKKVRNYREGDTVLRSRLYDKDLSIPNASSRFGGFVERAVVTDVWSEKGLEYGDFPHPQQKVPEYIDPVFATALIVLKENLHCIKSTDVRHGHSLAIVGTGPAAQTMTMWAKIIGISPVVVFGRREKWSKRFYDLGADLYVTGHVINPELEKILRTGGFDRAIEAVGSNAALSLCREITKPDGRIHLYGMPADDESYGVDNETDPRVFRSKILEAEVHEEVLQFIGMGKVNLKDWVSHVFPWNEYQKAFAIVREQKPTKVVVTLN
jgi:D-arabinose 1-dehydrogenase-like Zn-dependent alcohol dehydrogenase